MFVYQIERIGFAKECDWLILSSTLTCFFYNFKASIQPQLAPAFVPICPIQEQIGTAIIHYKNKYYGELVNATELLVTVQIGNTCKQVLVATLQIYSGLPLAKISKCKIFPKVPRLPYIEIISIQCINNALHSDQCNTLVIMNCSKIRAAHQLIMFYIEVDAIPNNVLY